MFLTNEELHDLQQDIFDRVYLGLKGQGFRPSVTLDNPGCAYRGAEGLKCAAGHLIPDDDYRESMEGYPASDLDFFKKKYDSEVMKFIDTLQEAHDGGFGRVIDDGVVVDLFYFCSNVAPTPEGVKENLEVAAMYFGLTVPTEEDHA
jgi:hypothetical protein